MLSYSGAFVRESSCQPCFQIIKGSIDGTFGRVEVQHHTPYVSSSDDIVLWYVYLTLANHIFNHPSCSGYSHIGKNLLLPLLCFNLFALLDDKWHKLIELNERFNQSFNRAFPHVVVRGVI